MATLAVLVHLPDRAAKVGILSTEHSASAYEKPVLLLDNHPHGPGDIFDPGGWEAPVLVGELPLSPALSGTEGLPLLETWREMTRAFLGREETPPEIRTVIREEYEALLAREGEAASGPRPIVAILRRLAFYAPQRRAFYSIRGKETEASDENDVNIPMGPVGGGTAWWDPPLPACPDCGGVLIWWEAGYAPGTRRCVHRPVGEEDGRAVYEPGRGCGSFFTVEVREGGGA